MTELSPSAKAVLDAANGACCFAPDDELNDSRWIAGAVLRTAANRLLTVRWSGQMPVGATEQIGINWARDALHVLANELEAS